jgi:hypothetical protein
MAVTKKATQWSPFSIPESHQPVIDRIARHSTKSELTAERSFCIFAGTQLIPHAST